MDIQSSKLELVKLIVNLENQQIIEKLINTIKQERGDFWDELSEAEKDEIRLGMKQLDEGQRISLDDFLKKVA
jgi:hypothetical protein